MLDERRPDLGPETVDDVQHTGREELLAEATEERRGQRRVFGRLQNGGVAAEDRGKHLPRVVRQRRVEGDDQRSDPDRARVAITVRFGVADVVVRPYSRRPSPATKKPISMAASVSPSARSSDLPVSSTTVTAISSRRARSASAISRTSSPRCTGVRAAQSACAARAAATAAATSAASERDASQSKEPSAGRSLSNVRPDAETTSRPTTRLRMFEMEAIAQSD